ncbi:serine hydrolase [Castellaniella sp.]|uniref:serine hydrolase n=1 Tax=Castellaniella sp. TaxID=1955812 RepID=UPI002B0009C6|nr:serine hydrolase [Castellaniella sp.]
MSIPRLRILSIMIALVSLSACNDGSSVADTTIPAENVTRAVAQLDGLAAEIMHRSGIPGMAVAVVHQGKTVYAKGFGVRQAGTDAAIDPNTVFQLASISKSVGATVVASQVGKGLITWDTPITSQLPWFVLENSDAPQAVTIGDLYAHRSGLPEHAGDDLEDLGFQRRQVLERLGHLPTKPLRSSYAYTNFGLTAAAEAVAHAAATDWESLSQREIYQPLGMHSTSSRYLDFMAHENRARPHIQIDGAFVLNPQQRQPDAQSPAGGVSSSVLDMARWMTMVLHQGKVNGQPLLPADALAPALSPQYLTSPATEENPSTGYYGYGFNITVPTAGHIRYGHSGGFNMGAATNFSLLPDADTGIIVLTNALPVGAAEALGMMYMDLVQYGKITRDWLTGYQAIFAQELAPFGQLAGQNFPAAPTLPLSFNAYVGTYANDYYGQATITEKAGQLIMSMGPIGTEKNIPLQHWSGNVFVFDVGDEMASAGSRSAVSFAISPSGISNSLSIELYEKNGRGTLMRQ